MTKVLFDIKKGMYLLKAEGHATGSAEVCAAISGLVYALDGFCMNYALRQGESCERRLDSGEAFFLFKAKEDSEAMKAAFLTAGIGLMQIALVHPEYISVFDNSEFN